MTTAVSVEGISKRYRLGTIGSGTLISDLQRWWRQARRQPVPESKDAGSGGKADQLHTVQREAGAPESDTFIWALRDVTFKVLQGEAVGIIGRNGAGKSTLLKILSQVTAPTSGIVRARGRIASLLEVGTGFHPELTGRENTYLNGAILGMSREEVRRKFDEIVDFSGVEQFIDTPVKHFSSGMYVRLAFAVAAHLEPDILIVDEVLAVGDTAFQKKCLGKIEDVTHTGRTVLFVSHNMSAVADLCRSAFWLDKGRIVLAGEARSVVSAYLGQYSEPRRLQAWNSLQSAPGNQTVRLLSAAIESEAGYDPEFWTVETPLSLTFKIFNFREDLPFHVDIKAFTKEGTCIFQSASVRRRHAFGVVESSCKIPAQLLNDGYYSVAFSAHYVGTEGVAVEGALAFEIHDVPRDIFPADKWPGLLRPELHWSMRDMGAAVEMTKGSP